MGHRPFATGDPRSSRRASPGEFGPSTTVPAETPASPDDRDPMPAEALAVATDPDRTADPGTAGRLARLVAASCRSPATARAYRGAVLAYLAWRGGEPAGPLLSAPLLDRWIVALLAGGSSWSAVTQAISGVRALARIGAAEGFLDPAVVAALALVRGAGPRGVRPGRWLTIAEAERFLAADPARKGTQGHGPAAAALRILRDRAAVALVLGCGLRRAEAAAALVSHLRTSEGRAVLADLPGKGRIERTVPVPGWAAAAIHVWLDAGTITVGPILRAIAPGAWIVPAVAAGAGWECIGTGTIRDLIRARGFRAGIGVVRPHDLRRTWAHLAVRGGSSLLQIRLSLGHASVVTTERYLGDGLDLADAPCDRLGLAPRWDTPAGGPWNPSPA